MNLKGSFPAQVLVLLGGAAAVLVYPLSVYASEEIRLAVAAGALLSTVNVLLGYVAIAYAFDKSYTTFLKAVLGGMGLRMALMLGALLALILVAHLHATALTISMVGFYAVYLVLEILYIQRTLSVKNQG